MVEVRWTLGARDDLRSIWAYLAQDSRARADRFISVLLQHSEQLISQPLSGKPVPEVGRRTLRELVHGSYRIIYLVVDQNTIDILAVHHGKRMLTRTFLSGRILRSKNR